MAKKLRRRFIVIFMIIVFLALNFIIGSTNIINIINMDRTTTATLEYLAQKSDILESSGSNGVLDILGAFNDLSAYSKSSYQTRYFEVVFDRLGAVKTVKANNISAVSNEDAVEYAKQVLNEKSNPGYFKSVYKYLVSIGGDGEEINVYFLDIGREVSSCASFITISLIVAYFTLLIFFILVEILSDRMLRPIFENNKKQKQFITDAGHELKTPLAIISANTDVLELTVGKNEWIDSIHHQTERMNELIKNLLLLAKTEENEKTVEFTDFCVSETTEKAAKAFEPVASQSGKKLKLEIEEGLRFKGNPGNIEQLVTILTDNAVKYCDDDGTITIRLLKKNKHLILETENNVPGDYDFDSGKLFDRFYRSDHSRSRETGGYGIGLSLAQAIVTQHKGTIKATKKEDTVCFTVTFKTD